MRSKRSKEDTSLVSMVVEKFWDRCDTCPTAG